MRTIYKTLYSLKIPKIVPFKVKLKIKCNDRYLNNFHKKY